MGYILEVQKVYPDGHLLHPEWNGKNEHLGYINMIFKTKKQACDYYDKHNPHLRPLNAHNTYRSDWDTETYIEYVIREYGGEYLKIPPFVDKHTILTNKEGNSILIDKDYISKFIDKFVEKTGEPKDRIKKTEVYSQFKFWFQQEHGIKKKIPKGQELYDHMDNELGLCKSTGWQGVKINYPDKTDEIDNI
jgi:hypothetical protein